MLLAVSEIQGKEKARKGKPFLLRPESSPESSLLPLGERTAGRWRRREEGSGGRGREGQTRRERRSGERPPGFLVSLGGSAWGALGAGSKKEVGNFQAPLTGLCSGRTTSLPADRDVRGPEAAPWGESSDGQPGSRAAGFLRGAAPGLSAELPGWGTMN